MEETSGTAPVMTIETDMRPIITEKVYLRLGIMQGLLSLAAAFIVFFSLFGIVVVPSSSMYPTLEIGSKLMYRAVSADTLDYDDIVLFFPYANCKRPIAGGLEVLFRSHVKDEVIYVKRLIGKSGDVLEMKDGYVYRNGEKLDPDYIAEAMYTDGSVYVVPEGHIFCMGDNRNSSVDCRYIGAIPCENFFGEVFLYT